MVVGAADTDSRIHAELRQERKATSLQQTFGLSRQEAPIEDFSCALQKKILMHGRMFVTHEHVCFSSNVFGVKTILVLAFRDVVAMSKGMHSLINPSIRVATATDEYVFASFFFRDHTWVILREVWRLQRRLNGFDTDQPPASARTAASAPTEKLCKSRRCRPLLDGPDAAAVPTTTPSAHEAAAPVAAASPAKAPPSPVTPATAGTAAAVTAEPLPHLVSLGGDSIDCSVAEAEAVLLADGSSFLCEFKTAQGGSKVDVGEWTAVDGAGGKVREVRLVQAVKSKLSPVRETRVEETQQCSALPDGSVVVQTHQVMVDAPYGDYFVVLSKWVFAPPPAEAGEGGCTVRVSCDVAFHKDSWFKHQIQANAVDELRGNYNVFLPLVREKLEARSGGSSSDGGGGGAKSSGGGAAAGGRSSASSRHDGNVSGSGSSRRSSAGSSSPPQLPSDSPTSDWRRQELSGDALAAAAAAVGGGGVAQLIGACTQWMIALSAPLRRFSGRTSANVRGFFLPRCLCGGVREPSRARRAARSCALWLLLPLLVAAAVSLHLMPPRDAGALGMTASDAAGPFSQVTLHAAAATRAAVDMARAASVEAASALGYVPRATMQAQLDEVRHELRQLAAAHADLSAQVRPIDQNPAGRAVEVL